MALTPLATGSQPGCGNWSLLAGRWEEAAFLWQTLEGEKETKSLTFLLNTISGAEPRGTWGCQDRCWPLVSSQARGWAEAVGTLTRGSAPGPARGMGPALSAVWVRAAGREDGKPTG